jgi:hypothetical protein
MGGSESTHDSEDPINIYKSGICEPNIVVVLVQDLLQLIHRSLLRRLAVARCDPDARVHGDPISSSLNFQQVVLGVDLAFEWGNHEAIPIQGLVQVLLTRDNAF